MKNLTVVLLFAFSVLSLGMALRVRRELNPAHVTVERKPAPDASAHGKRGQPGPDDSDEEDEEDVRSPAAR